MDGLQLLTDSDNILLTDGGLESTLIGRDGIDLPHFAAVDMLTRDGGEEHLKSYFRSYLEIAKKHELGFVFESVTWRANPDWAERLGYSVDETAVLNHRAIVMLRELQNELDGEKTPSVVSGCIGPRGDGYVASELMTPDQAADYHQTQIDVLAFAGADVISAYTMTNAEEAVGIAMAAQAAKISAVISFTVETDGRLPTGQPLQDAIEQVDAATSTSVLHFMINCAHPSHFANVFEPGAAWLRRIGGLRANASKLSHEELDSLDVIDDGDPVELGEDHRPLLGQLPSLRMLGGCCGTDQRHVAEIAKTIASRELRGQALSAS